MPSLHKEISKKGLGGKTMLLKNIKRQMQDVDLWRAAAAEFLATFIFMFIVCITHMIPDMTSNSYSTKRSSERTTISAGGDPLQTSVGIALIYATLIQCFEHISGGHMNPAISVAMVIAGHITMLKAFLYSIAQLTGAFSAAALCYGMMPERSEQLRAVAQLHEDITPLQGFGLEILQTTLVTVTWLATYATSKTQLGSSALPVGMAYLANSLWAGRLTGSSMNPARSLPPALLSKYWKNLWVYVAGPLAGCIVGAVLYTQVFITSPKTERTRKLTESGRSAEGESVQSDQDATEMIPLNQLNQHRISSASQQPIRVSITNRQNSFASTTVGSQPDQNQQCVSQNHQQMPAPLLYLQQQVHSTSTPAVQNVLQYSTPRPVQHHPTLPATERNPNANTKPRLVRYHSSSGDGMVLSRNFSKPASRPHTACGPLVGPSSRTNEKTDTIMRSRSHAATPASNFRTLSLSEPFSHSSDALINNSVL
ncbi:unnamed protein product [Clavelina lepadiformis]|uniref:Aquaporin n=1 Tax=Clavelina lepadiformis TaxID=159417 RepID=A0ABP0FZ59_CLALP